MKPIITRLTGKTGYFFLAPYYLLRAARKHAPLLLVLLTVLLTSCFQHYFKTNSKNSIDAPTFQRLLVSNKYFILHYKDGIVALTNITLSGETMQAEKAPLLPEHMLQLNPEREKIAEGSRIVNKKSYRVNKADKEFVLVEVHLYTGEAAPPGNNIVLPLSSFYRADVYEFDKASTKTNHIFSWLGVSLATAAAITGIAVLIACNCPQVYVNNNGQYEFKSGVYSGAVYSSLERTDYLPLTGMQPVNGTYQLRINNAKEEEQFINQVNLLQVSHPADAIVLADRHGKIHSYKNPVSPVSATYNDGADATQKVRYADDVFYPFDSEAGKGGFSTITMQFPNPGTVTKGKLIVHAGNSAWSGYLYREFASLFGTGYEKWRQQQEKNPAADAQQWQRDQGLPMRVSVWTNNGWQYVDHFALTGNTSKRDMIMEIDFINTPPGDIKIRLETVYRFWDLDRVAMDFSADLNLQTDLLQPSVAVSNTGVSFRDNLKEADKQYAKLTGTDFLQLEFPATPTGTDGSTSFFLVTGGYYHTLQKFNGKPDTGALLKFRDKSAFDRFSRQKQAAMEEIFAKGAVK